MARNYYSVSTEVDYRPNEANETSLHLVIKGMKSLCLACGKDADRQDHTIQGCKLQLSLNRIGSFIVKNALELFFTLEHHFPCEEDRARKFFYDKGGQYFRFLNNIYTCGETVVGSKTKLMSEINIMFQMFVLYFHSCIQFILTR